MTQKQLQERLEREYDRIIAETLAELKRKKPLTKSKLAAALMEANKKYWAIRIALLDTDAVNEAERVAAALSIPYAAASSTLGNRVRNIYAGYESAFGLTRADAKELLDKVVYDRSIADNLQAIAESMQDGEEKTRILAEISAPAYRYRLQRAEQLTQQAQEICDNIARREVITDRTFLQTEAEKAYNITLDETLGKTPAEAVLDEVIPEPIQLRALEMPKSETPLQDFTPTTDKGILDSFSITSTRNVDEVVNRDWSGDSFSSRVWNNTDELAREVKQVLLEGELTGASEADMAAKIAERFEVGMHKARRVVRTESNYCTNQAELKGLQDAGFDEFQFITLEEESVCDVCDSLNGMIFKMSEAAVGVNMPPMHPFCRCKITSPEQTEEDIQREIDERIDSWNIPEGMSLDEFIDRVNNGELEQIRAEQAAAENSSEGVDKSEESGIIEEKKEPVSIFLEHTDNLYLYAQKIEPLPDYTDLVIHGDKSGFAYRDADGKESPINVKEFADIYKKSGLYHGGKIRLISCETAAVGANTAQWFANEMGVELLAPTDMVWIDIDGKMTIGPDQFTDSGKWVPIIPKRTEG